MKISNKLQQGSKEWLAFRGTGLGASDAPVIMGESPWTTPFELWAHKTKLLQPPEPHIMAAVAMKRGTDLEPKAREIYEKQTGYKLSIPNVEHELYPYIRASLDGLCDDPNVIVEIKSPGKADLIEASKGKVPKKYYWQLMQQLLLVPGAEWLDYVTYDGKETIYITKVERNKADEERLLKALLYFWNLVDKKVPPPVDYKDMTRVITRLAKDYERLSSSMNALTVIHNCLMQSPTVVDESGFVKVS